MASELPLAWTWTSESLSEPAAPPQVCADHLSAVCVPALSAPATASTASLFYMGIATLDQLSKGNYSARASIRFSLVL